LTARLLRELIAESTRCEPDPGSTLIFANARGSGLTRYGVRYLLRRYVAKGARLAPTLRDKSLHPHSIRHSTAIALLKAGVDFATISQWLGHAGLNTTMRYARADLDLKRQAISQVFPDALAHLVGVGCSSTARIWSVGSGGSRRTCAGGHLTGVGRDRDDLPTPVRPIARERFSRGRGP